MTGNLGNGGKRDLKQRDGMKFYEAGQLSSSLWQKAVSVFVTSKRGILRDPAGRVRGEVP